MYGLAAEADWLRGVRGYIDIFLRGRPSLRIFNKNVTVKRMYHLPKKDFGVFNGEKEERGEVERREKMREIRKGKYPKWKSEK